MGARINLNGGGSPGTPVQTLQPTALNMLADEGDDGSSEPPQDNNQGPQQSSPQNPKEPESPEPPPDLNHMFASLKGVDGIQSNELVYKPFI